MLLRSEGMFKVFYGILIQEAIGLWFHLQNNQFQSLIDQCLNLCALRQGCQLYYNFLIIIICQQLSLVAPHIQTYQNIVSQQKVVNLQGRFIEFYLLEANFKYLYLWLSLRFKSQPLINWVQNQMTIKLLLISAMLAAILCGPDNNANNLNREQAKLGGYVECKIDSQFTAAAIKLSALKYNQEKTRSGNSLVKYLSIKCKLVNGYVISIIWQTLNGAIVTIEVLFPKFKIQDGLAQIK